VEVVALCGLSREAGGLFYAVRSLCKALDREGVGISVFGRRDASVSRDLPSWSPVAAKAFGSHGPLGYSPALRQSLMAAGCGLVHQHGIWMDDQWAALRWQKKQGGPVVVSPHGMLDPWAVRNSAWKKKLVGAMFANEALRQATCIHALCPSEAKAIRAYGLRNPIAIIPNGIDLPGDGVRQPSSGGRKTVLFLGRIHPKKGIAELLRAWGRVSKDWKLVIAGWDDGGHEQGLRKLVEDLGLGGSVSFVGPKHGEEKDRLLRSVDAFILPSFSEGLPMSVLEAWSFRLPVVMTDFCNLPEGFAANAAIRVEPDADSIFQGLEKLTGLSDEGRGDMGTQGRTLVEEKFAWDKIARDMKAVYEWCLGGEKPACIAEGEQLR